MRLRMTELCEYRLEKFLKEHFNFNDYDLSEIFDEAHEVACFESRNEFTLGKPYTKSGKSESFVFVESDFIYNEEN